MAADTWPRVAIIGGGLGGIAAAAKLQQAGVADFTLFEKSDGPGGVWRDNCYPGAGCDIPSHLYSFSFRLNPEWKRAFATQSEILAYIEETVDALGIRSRCRFRTAVTSCTWDEHGSVWLVHTSAGETLAFEVVISALGLLNVPWYPDLPGMGEFSGPMFHTARWEHEHDLTGKRVAVIGAGSTSAQVIPATAPRVERLYAYQREPAWVIPKPDRAFTARDREAFARWPGRMRLERAKVFVQGEFMAMAAVPGSRMAKRVSKLCLDQLAEQVPDPQLRRMLTPDYPFFCKRPVLSRDIYPALVRPNVELVPRAVTGFTRDGVLSDDGVERAVDIVILATGFQPSRFLQTLDVVGLRGRRLHDIWEASGGAEALLGVTVPGFPNFFMLYGPNTNSATTSLIFVLERQAEYSVRMIWRMIRSGSRSIDASERAMALYNRWLQRELRKTAWTVGRGCHNYYRSPSGKIVTNWPKTAILYALILRVLGPATAFASGSG